MGVSPQRSRGLRSRGSLTAGPRARKPLAPALSASYTCSSRSNVVGTRTRGGRGSRASSRAAAMPSSAGIRISRPPRPARAPWPGPPPRDRLPQDQRPPDPVRRSGSREPSSTATGRRRAEPGSARLERGGARRLRSRHRARGLPRAGRRRRRHARASRSGRCHGRRCPSAPGPRSQRELHLALAIPKRRLVGAGRACLRHVRDRLLRDPIEGQLEARRGRERRAFEPKLRRRRRRHAPAPRARPAPLGPAAARGRRQRRRCGAGRAATATRRALRGRPRRSRAAHGERRPGHGRAVASAPAPARPSSSRGAKRCRRGSRADKRPLGREAASSRSCSSVRARRSSVCTRLARRRIVEATPRRHRGERARTTSTPDRPLGRDPPAGRQRPRRGTSVAVRPRPSTRRATSAITFLGSAKRSSASASSAVAAEATTTVSSSAMQRNTSEAGQTNAVADQTARKPPASALLNDGSRLDLRRGRERERRSRHRQVTRPRRPASSTPTDRPSAPVERLLPHRPGGSGTDRPGGRAVRPCGR